MKVYNEAHLNILTTTKDVYINQIINNLQKFIYEGILSIYKESMDTDKKNRFNLFKNYLSDIPKWNSVILNTEYKRFLENNNEKKFERLIRATFLTYTKILSSVKMNEKKATKVTVVIPDNMTFIHNCYIECAREFYKNVNLLDHELKNVEKQKNLKESLIIIKDSINKSIECMLPIDDIISQNLLEESEEEVEEESQEEEVEEESEEEEVEDNKNISNNNSSLITPSLNKERIVDITETETRNESTFKDNLVQNQDNSATIPLNNDLNNDLNNNPVTIPLNNDLNNINENRNHNYPNNNHSNNNHNNHSNNNHSNNNHNNHNNHSNNNHNNDINNTNEHYRNENNNEITKKTLKVNEEK
jgi:hypothetical protein